MDVHFFLNRTLSSGYPEKDTAGYKSDSSENNAESEAVTIVNSSEDGGDVGHDTSRTVNIGPYTRAQMTPDMVHTGLLVQDSIDEENEFVKRCIEEDIQLTNQYRVCENAMKQYHKTRTEATHAGVKAAKLMVKTSAITSIHPLIAGTDVTRCHSGVVEKAAFVRALQTFRPSQTVLETGIGTGSSSNKAQKKAIEKANKLQSRNATGSKVVLPGVDVMQQLRKVMMPSLERLKPKVDINEILEGGKVGEVTEEGPETNTATARDKRSWMDVEEEEYGDEGDDDDYGGSSSSSSGRATTAVTAVRKSAAAGASAAVPGSAASGNFFSGSMSVSLSNPANTGSTTGTPFATMGVSLSGDSVKQRMSAADRKKIKKYGDLSNAPVSSSSSSGTRTGSSSNSHAVKRNREEEVMASVDTNKYKDNKFYMAYGNEDVRETFAETSLQPQSHLRASEQQSANMLEQSMLDVIPEEILELNKKRRLLRWDSKKRKFVKQTVEEMAEQGGKNKRIRTESGVVLKNSKVKPGEMYAKWKKKTQKDISLPAQTSGFGVNNHVVGEADSGSVSNAPVRSDYRKGFGGGRGGGAKNNFNSNNRSFDESEGSGNGRGGKAGKTGKGDMTSKRNADGKIKAAAKFGTGAFKPAVSANGQKQRKSNFDAPESSLNFKANSHVKSELKTKQEIKKNKAAKADNALKNMSKEKRAHVTGKMKQAKAAGPMNKKALLASQRGGKKKSRVYVR